MAKKSKRRRQRPRRGDGSPPTVVALRDNVVLRFVLLFALLMFVFQLVYYQFIVESSLFRSYLSGSAWIAATLLRWIGEDVTSVGTTLLSEVTISVNHGCDGLQAMWILVAGVLSFPGARASKVIGIALGAGVLFLLNVIRIASLFWIQANSPALFDRTHLYVWPAVFVFAAMLLWLFWAGRTARSREAV